MTMNHRSRSGWIALVLVSALAVAGCGADAPPARTEGSPAATPAGGTATVPTATPPARNPVEPNATSAPVAATPAPTIALATGEAVVLSFDEFYSGHDVRTGLKLSEKLRGLDGRRVRIEGYMAPPLKAELDFFVLTRIRLAYCPFCSTAGDWPDDIAVVYLLGDPMRTTDRPLRLEGTLELGQRTDPETGMVSLVRIFADRVDLL